MKVEVDLDRLEDYIFWSEPQCGVCQVRFGSKIDCPQKSGTVSKNSCNCAIMKYLKGENE